MEKGDEQKRIRKRKMIEEGIERRDDTRKETKTGNRRRRRETRKKESDKKEGVNTQKRSRRKVKRR